MGLVRAGGDGCGLTSPDAELGVACHLGLAAAAAGGARTGSEDVVGGASFAGRVVPVVVLELVRALAEEAHPAPPHNRASADSFTTARTFQLRKLGMLIAIITPTAQ